MTAFITAVKNTMGTYATRLSAAASRKRKRHTTNVEPLMTVERKVETAAVKFTFRSSWGS